MLLSIVPALHVINECNIETISSKYAILLGRGAYMYGINKLTIAFDYNKLKTCVDSKGQIVSEENQQICIIITDHLEQHYFLVVQVGGNVSL